MGLSDPPPLVYFGDPTGTILEQLIRNQLVPLRARGGRLSALHT
jgi:hypothetical protein